MSRMTHVNLAPRRSTLELFEEVHRTQCQLQTALDKSNSRQKRFKKALANETQHHHHTIMEHLHANNTIEATMQVLMSAPTDVNDHTHSATSSFSSSRHEQHPRRSFLEPVDPNVARIKDDLKCFYTPTDATTKEICEICHSFRLTTLVHSLPSPWEEFECNTTGKRYYFHPETKVVRWTPPPETNPFSVYVFNHTNSVFSVCHCPPSHERKRRVLLKFKEYAKEYARAEAAKKDNQLRGTFHKLALTLMKK
jgi:hypothetical protein